MRWGSTSRDQVPIQGPVPIPHPKQVRGPNQLHARPIQVQVPNQDPKQVQVPNRDPNHAANDGRPRA